MKLGCPNCGANVFYKIGTKSVYCPHCESETDIAVLNKKVKKTISKQTSFDSSAYTCSSCGSRIVSVDNQPISICNFCGSTNFSNTSIKFNINDKEIIPFEYSKEAFLTRFKAFVAKNELSNFRFFKEENIQKITGMYIPLVSNQYTMEYITNGLYKQHSKESKHLSVTNNYSYSGTYKVGLTFDTANEFPDYLTSNILPYDLTKKVDYSPYYFCGLSVVETTDFTNKKFIQSIPKVKYILDKTLPIQYLDSASKLPQSNIYKFKTEETKRYYVPVWHCTYKHGDNTYSFTMNGQTGAITSFLPADHDKMNNDFEKATKSIKSTEFKTHFIAFVLVSYLALYICAKAKAPLIGILGTMIIVLIGIILDFLIMVFLDKDSYRDRQLRSLSNIKKDAINTADVYLHKIQQNNWTTSAPGSIYTYPKEAITLDGESILKIPFNNKDIK